ncbi:MAG TPA: hypothetical protein VHV77_06730 [Pirellulales bacterium]|jgi:hypothetical protein|nr:hypothetical protein [Pirellulales bacterium]
MLQVPREQLFVCPTLQGRLVLRVLLYWLACITLTWMSMLAWRMFVDPEAPLVDHVRALSGYLIAAMATGLILLPVLIVDVVHLSNKFFGPLVRLRAAMRRLATGERVMPLHFRRGDFWHEFAVEFRDLADRIETERTTEVEV